MALIRALHAVLVGLFIASNILLIPVSGTIGAALGLIVAENFALAGTAASLIKVLGGFMMVGLINGGLATLVMILWRSQPASTTPKASAGTTRKKTPKEKVAAQSAQTTKGKKSAKSTSTKAVSKKTKARKATKAKKARSQPKAAKKTPPQ